MLSGASSDHGNRLSFNLSGAISLTITGEMTVMKASCCEQVFAARFRSDFSGALQEFICFFLEDVGSSRYFVSLC